MAYQGHLHALCLSVIQQTVEHYGWHGRWIESEVVAEILIDLEHRTPRVQGRRTLEEMVKNAATYCYSRRWHVACGQNQTMAQQEALVSLHKYLYLFTFKRVNGHAEIAQDIAQKSLMSIWGNLEKVREPGTFIRYAQQTTQRLIGRLYQEKEPTELNPDWVDPKTISPDDAILSPHAHVEEIINQCLRAKARRKVIIENILNNRTINDIAEEMGITPNAASLLKRNALKQLGECDQVKELREKMKCLPEEENEERDPVRYLLDAIDGVLGGMTCDECSLWLPEFVRPNSVALTWWLSIHRSSAIWMPAPCASVNTWR